MTDYEKFIHNYGYKYTGEEALKAAYDRSWKAKHDICISEDEFVAEADAINEPKLKMAKETYAVLAKLVDEKKLKPSDVYSYAHFRWCLKDASAVVAYEIENGKFEVNSCDTEISVEQAILVVNSEWGFEASRVKIIGTPYYDATDWMFIRFDCAHMTWLYSNGNLYKVVG